MSVQPTSIETKNGHKDGKKTSKEFE